MMNFKNTNEATPLMMAISAGCLESVKHLIKKGADVNKGRILGSGPLSWALQNELYEIASLLMKCGANVKEPNIRGLTPMYYAINKDSPTSIIQEFIDHGVSVDASLCEENGLNEEGGIVPLVKAIANNNIPVVKFLLERSVQITFSTTTDDGSCKKMSALTMAVGSSSIESVKLLISHGANVDGYGDECPSPLHTAVLNKDMSYIRALISAGADIDKDYQLDKIFHLKQGQVEPELTALQLAALNGRCDAAKELLNAGADVNKATLVMKKTPLNLACEVDSTIDAVTQQKMVELLLKNGADMYTRNKDDCSPVLTCLIFQRFYLIGKMLDAGLNVNTDIGELGSLLFYSMKNDIPQLVKLCLEFGGDSKQRFKNNTSAYEEALKRGLHMAKLFFPYFPVDGVCVCASHSNALRRSPMLKNQFLFFDGIKKNKQGAVLTALQNGAEPRAFLTNMRFPIFRPVANNNIAMLRVLLNHGVCPNVQNNKKETPLHVAARKGFTEVCFYLLQHGACHNGKSSDGQSPLEFATAVETIKLLKGIRLLFHRAKKNDVNLIKGTFSQMPDTVFFSYINCVNHKGNTMMQEAILSGAGQAAETIMSFRLCRPLKHGW